MILARELDSSQLSKGWLGSQLNKTAHSLVPKRFLAAFQASPPKKYIYILLQVA